MWDTNHYIVAANDTDIEIHTRNIPEEKASAEIQTGIQNFVRDSANGIFFGEIFNVSDTINIYRRMCEEEIKKVLNNNALINDYAYKHKLVTGSLNKALEFQNRGVSEPIQKIERIVQMTID
ncbi:unnamed protein product [Rotaria sordida]|uniref:Uncharacterized protein n=1 Tax=Rotaria sordida TaxID=392033 RepID=A0A815HBB6_9BILA|nr:unnamed protein product [Rotaria sordida]CAF1525113.1 unnamed protein product [Rotaria sordida]CAF3912548.1 unnamed protein product [Rotaria sordida]CAF4135184.1 unnamed protein product [Rotaria sordida]